MKRVVFLVAALFFCTSSVFAWNAESFTNGSVYEFEPVMSMSTFSLDRGVSLYASGYDDPGGYSEVDWTQASLSFGSDGQSSQHFFLYGSYELSLPNGTSYTINSIADEADASVYMPDSSSYFSWRTASTSLTPSWPSGSREEAIEYCAAYSTTLRFDLPVDGSSSTMDFSIYIPSSFVRLYYNGSKYSVTYPSTGQLYINGTHQKTYNFVSGKLDVSSDIFNLTDSISSAYFEISIPAFRYFGDIPVSSASNWIWWSYFSKQSFMRYSLLTSGALDGFNDQAQNSINEHESIESQWTGSMTENFNALDLESFTFPNGLVAAFALITGIFQDLWNGMGEYKILYVFPLTLAIALLLVGRISKFAGNSGSGRNKGGDDGA